MKVKVTWRCNNPFASIDQLSRISEADLEDSISFKEIKEFADTATPDGYFLKKITMPTEVVEYDRMGEAISQEPKYDILQLQKMATQELAIVARDYNIDTKEMRTQNIIYKILEEQAKG